MSSSWEAATVVAVNGLRAPWLDAVVAPITEYGLYAFPLVIAVVAGVRRTPTALASMRDGWLAFLLSLFVSETLLKPLVGRPRPTAVEALREQLHVLGSVPPAASLGCPSGTATACMAGATWIALRHEKRWGIAAIAGAVVVSSTRLYVGVHYPLDLVLGWLVGAATAVVVDRWTRAAHGPAPIRRDS